MQTAASLNRLTSTIVGAAIKIHRSFGPGLLESAYLACLCHQLKAQGLRLETQRPLPLVFEGLRLECAYRADLIVDDAVLVEVKALETVARVHRRQLNTYVHLADCRVGLLLNFGAETMRAGIIRIGNRFPTE